MSAIDAARRFIALFVFALESKTGSVSIMIMTYPDQIRAELETAIALALQNAKTGNLRTRKVSQSDIIKALICMEGGSLQKGAPQGWSTNLRLRLRPASPQNPHFSIRGCSVGLQRPAPRYADLLRLPGPRHRRHDGEYGPRPLIGLLCAPPWSAPGLLSNAR